MREPEMCYGRILDTSFLSMQYFDQHIELEAVIDIKHTYIDAKLTDPYHVFKSIDILALYIMN